MRPHELSKRHISANIQASSSSIIDSTKTGELFTHAPLSLEAANHVIPSNRGENPNEITVLHIILRNTIAGGIGIGCTWKVA